jgi:DNA repair exonuclease SbcCD ATPase subunit
MDIRINKLILQNFKGIKNLVIDAGGESLTIYGDNATGKTTVFDAFTWLLFGKDSLGRSDFGIKTQDENGNTLHNLEHSAECEMQIDENILTLKKVYAEKWTKKRGSSEAEFSGHETKYFVNEVPATKKEYEQKIASVIDETLFKIITNPLYFNEHLKWQDRRTILLNLCDNITDDEIITNNAEFSLLGEELKGRTVQEYKKIIQSKQSAINDNLKVIPQRISEALLAIPETVAEVDETEKANCEQRIADLNNEIMAIRNGAGVTDIEIELRALKERKAQLENSKCDISAMNQALFDAKINLQNTDREIDACRREIATLNSYIEYLSHQADALRKDWHEVNSKQYTDSGICPTCGQPLPTEQIEEAKAKFNISRAETLEVITEKGKRTKSEIESRTKRRLEFAENIDNFQRKANEYTAEIERLTKEIEKSKADFNESKGKELATLYSRIAETEKKAQNSDEDVKAKIYTIEEQIATERAKIAEIDKAIAGRDIVERQNQRIAELEADEKRLAKEYAELEIIAFLIDKFTKHKVDLLSEEINSHFKYAKFKLFEEQINGGIAECCEVTYKGVEYSDLNNAARISIGIDIINTLCKLNDKYAPIIVDNAESVTNIPQTTSQMVCLVVSAEDKTLRVEKGV